MYVSQIAHIIKALEHIKDHAEEFDDDIAVGVASWKRSVYRVRKQAQLEREHARSISLAIHDSDHHMTE